MKAMFIGTSAMSANQTALSTIANNIANASTTGFKSQEAKFQDLFYQQLQSASAPSGNYAGTNPMESGNGVKVSTLASDFTQGNINSTGKNGDLAIQGDGFFVLGDSEGGNRVYTRDGNFSTSKNNELVANDGKYVMGWNIDESTGIVNTSAAVEPIKIPLGTVSIPKQSTYIDLKGNLNAEGEVDEVVGLQVATYDKLGGKHDVEINFVRGANNEYQYVAVPSDQFRPSASIDKAVMHVSAGIIGDLQKGDYTIDTAAGTGGSVNITVKDPSGATVLTKNVTDTDQTVTLDDGTNKWFTIDYKGGNAPASSKFTVGEIGSLGFTSTGQAENVVGSAGSPKITYTPQTTGETVEIDLDLSNLKSLATDNAVALDQTDGSGAAVMSSYTVADGGQVVGYYSDGSVKQIGQVAMATFANKDGLSRVGGNVYTETMNSGQADIGVPNTGSRGQIKGQSLESSNVDLATQFVTMMTTQKNYQADTKIIRTANDALTSVIDLIR